MVGDSLELIGDGVVVEELQAGQTDVLLEKEIAQQEAELAGDQQHQAVDVAVALEHVTGQLLVMGAEGADRVGHHRVRDIEDARERPFHREVAHVDHRLQQYSLLGLVEDLEADEPLRDLAHHPSLLGADSFAPDLDDVVADDVAGDDFPLEPIEVPILEFDRTAIDPRQAFGHQQQRAGVVGHEGDDDPGLDPDPFRPFLGQRDEVRGSPGLLYLPLEHLASARP